MQAIHTDLAPKAIGTYSQAMLVDKTLYCSGQIPLDPATMQIIEGDISTRIVRVFDNLKAVAEAAGTSFANAIKLNVYLTDMSDFPHVNEVMAQYCQEPYPARAAVAVKELPKGVDVEIEAIFHVD